MLYLGTLTQKCTSVFFHDPKEVGPYIHELGVRHDQFLHRPIRITKCSNVQFRRRSEHLEDCSGRQGGPTSGNDGVAGKLHVTTDNHHRMMLIIMMMMMIMMTKGTVGTQQRAVPASSVQQALGLGMLPTQTRSSSTSVW